MPRRPGDPVTQIIQPFLPRYFRQLKRRLGNHKLNRRKPQPDPQPKHSPRQPPFGQSLIRKRRRKRFGIHTITLQIHPPPASTILKIRHLFSDPRKIRRPVFRVSEKRSSKIRQQTHDQKAGMVQVMFKREGFSPDACDELLEACCEPAGEGFVPEICQKG